MQNTTRLKQIKMSILKRLVSPGIHQLTRNLCTLLTPPTTKSQAASSLHRILTRRRNSDNVEQLFNYWIQNQGQSFDNIKDIFASVDHLCKFKEFHYALQLMEWSEKKGLIVLTCGSHTKCISLIAKTRGCEAAEKYFLDLPESAKEKSTYGALLHCYCFEKMKDKAMALFRKMQELNYHADSYIYCSLMSLHIKLGEPEKVPPLEREMKEKGIEPHLYRYNLLINAYSSLKDIKEVERVAEDVKTSSVIPDWFFYNNLALVYIEAGLVEKAELNLKKMEKLKLSDARAYHSLLAHYGKLGNAEEVDRIWESLKSAFPKTSNLSYLTRLNTLYKLGDMGGIKRCYEEWESRFTHYDIRLVNVLIKSYIKQDMIDEAQSVLDRILEKGYEPNFATYGPFVKYFVENREKAHDLAQKYLELGTPHVKSNEKRLYQLVKEMVLNVS